MHDASTRTRSLIARPAAVVSVPRFDSALRLNPRLHALFVDGVFTLPPGARRAMFHPLPPPSDADLARVAALILRRTLALLRERSLTREFGQGPLLDDELHLAAIAPAEQRELRLIVYVHTVDQHLFEF